MRKSELLAAFLLFSFLIVAGIDNASYWFQAGVRGSTGSNSNNGASVQIETVLPQNLGTGTMGFWAGENLPNGAFLQIGYLVENESGLFPTNCTRSGCSSSEYIGEGDAEWFYEYFVPGDNSTFLGSTGPDGSAGQNGQFNTYSFYSLGNTWYFQFNNKTIGSADLDTGNSGPYSPLAIGELANASAASTVMNKVIFANLSEYKYDMYLPLSEAFGTIGYGVGSDTFISNPYGVEEVGNRINYFEVGSGLPQYTNNTKLWNLGYKLKIISMYGNLSSGNSYTAYSSERISAPTVLYFNNFSRAMFEGWSGVGIGSYTGAQNTVSVILNSNLTETAQWQLQNFVNVTSTFDNATGTGWYRNGSTVYYGIHTGSISLNGKNFIFSGWSNGNQELNGSINVGAPENLTAEWKYRTEIFGKDGYGEVLDVPTFLIDGQRTNSTPLLNTTRGHNLQGAYYKGFMLPLNFTVEDNSPSVLFFSLPVYTVSVTTKDFFGLPVNVSATVSYKNGTQVKIYSGEKGVISVLDVPYGYANVSFSQSGLKSEVVANGGIAQTAYFISTINIGATVLGAMVLLYLFVWRKRSKVMPQPQAPAKPQQQQNAKA